MRLLQPLLGRVEHKVRSPSGLSVIQRCSRTDIIKTRYVRQLTQTSCQYAKQLPPRPKIDENDIEENFVKGSGPGGQKINKTNSAVQLLHKPTGIVIKCQETRSRTQNRTLARKWLSEKLEETELGPRSRVQIKMELERKRKASKAKKANRKYRMLDGETATTDADSLEVVEDNGKDDGIRMADQVESSIAKMEDAELPDWEKKWRALRGIP